jgi:hypothetical protein
VDDFGIDENDLLLGILGHGQIDNGDTLGNPNLRRGQADTLGGVTGLEHVVDKLMELRRSEFRYEFRLFLEYGLSVQDDRIGHQKFFT